MAPGRVRALETAGLAVGVLLLVASVAAYDIRAAVALLGIVIILASIDIPRRRP
jgi:hypothetical protein